MTKNLSKFPLPVILSAAKDLSSVPAVSLEKKILRRCAPQDDKEPEQIFPPVILSGAKDLSSVPAAPLEKKILRRCAPQDDKEREVFLGMTKKGKCSSG